jgi:WD40 repeat protein
MSSPASGGVFISYRRQESRHLAGRLYDRLVVHFGNGRVFMDVDDIQPGVDFAEAINRALSTCKVLLAVIGPHWLTATDEDGRRRLDDPDDLVCLEIATALDRGIRVIPILIDGAAMPHRQELPDRLAGLARRNAFSLRHESFSSDFDRLLPEIERFLSAPAVTEPTWERFQALRNKEDVNGDVNGVAFSPDGRLLATACDDETARIWKVRSGEEHGRVTHDGFVRGVAFSPDGGLLATASFDLTARVWKVPGWQEAARFTHQQTVTAVAFDPDGRLLATASLDLTARVWEVASGQERARLPHKQTVTAVAFSPDGNMLATASDDYACVWELVR